MTAFCDRRGINAERGEARDGMVDHGAWLPQVTRVGHDEKEWLRRHIVPRRIGSQ